MTKELVKTIEAPEKIDLIKQRPKYSQYKNKKPRKLISSKPFTKNSDLDYVEELKTQLTYGDTGHGIILDKKV